MRHIFSFGLASLLASSVCFAAETGAGSGAPADSKVEEKVVLKRNGIKRPESTSITGKLWDIADALSKELGKPAPRKAVVDKYMADVVGANAATAQTQYARWVAYHDAAPALAAAREAEKAERQAAKEAEKAEAEKADAEAKAAKAKEAEDAKAQKEAEKAAKAAEKEAEKQRKAEEKAAAKKLAEEKKAAEIEAKRVAEEQAKAKAEADKNKAA